MGLKLDQKLKLSYVLSFSNRFKRHFPNYGDYLWSTFQLNLTLLTGVVAPKRSKWVWFRPEPEKLVVSSELLLPIKIKNVKDPEAETWHPESRDGWSYYRLCVKISDDPLMLPQEKIYTQFFYEKKKKEKKLLNFTRILWFFWDVEHILFDIPKDTVFAEILVFSNILVLHGGKLGPNMKQKCKVWVFYIWAKMQIF